jgi:hypothetical protein
MVSLASGPLKPGGSVDSNGAPLGVVVRRRYLEVELSPSELRARKIAFIALLLLVVFTAGSGIFAYVRSRPPTRGESRTRALDFGRDQALRLAREAPGTAVGLAAEVFSWNDQSPTVYEASVVLELATPRRLRVVRIEALSQDDRGFDVRREQVIDEVALLPSERAADVARQRCGARFRDLAPLE